MSATTSLDELWPLLQPETRAWLIDHNGEALRAPVLAELTRLGGGIPQDAWWVGESGPEGFYLSDRAVDWVEAVANGEAPEVP